MTEQVIERFHDSLERCRQNPAFLDTFYARLLAASPEIPSYFRDTDFRRQKRVLTMSFYHLLAAADGNPEGDVHIQRIAEIHAARNIPRAIYDVWLDCLVATVAQHDPQYSPEVADAWRRFMGPGIAAMRASAPG